MSLAQTWPSPEEQRRAECARAPTLAARAAHVDPAKVVFIDETCTSTNMVRQRGRSPRGETSQGYDVVAALRQSGMTHLV
jgi:hypothetical protein